MDKNLACQWINNGTIDTLPQSRDELIKELYILYYGDELVSRDAVKAGLQKSGIIQINNNGRINYNTSITMDQVLAAFDNNEERKRDSITPLIIAEKVARWIRRSCMGDLFSMEKDFNMHINSLIDPPEIISLVHQLIDGSLIEICSDNSVLYPHLKSQDTGESPHKKQKTISVYDYDIKTDEEDNNDEDNEGCDSENSTENNEEDGQERMNNTGGESRNNQNEEHRKDNESGRETGNDETNSERIKIGESSKHNQPREDEEEETESATEKEEQEKEKEKEKEKQKEKEKETFIDRAKEPSKYTFKDLEFNEKVLGALKIKGIETCNNIQAKLITAILDGKHILCLSPAGSGKTTGYLSVLLQRVDAKLHHTQLVILTTSSQSTNHVTSILGWLCPVLELCFHNADEDCNRSPAHIVVGSIANIRESMRNVKTVVFQDSADLFSDTSKNATFDFFRDCSHTTQVICIGQNSKRPMQRILESFQTKFLHSKFSSIFFPSTSFDNESFPLIKSHRFIHCKRGAEIIEMMRIIREEKQVVGKKIIVMATKRLHCDEAYKELERKNLAVGYVRIGLQKQEISPMLAKFRESDMNILVVQGGVQLGDITTQVVINVAMQGIPDKYLQRTRNCGRDGVIYNIVPLEDCEKILIVRDKYNI